MKLINLNNLKKFYNKIKEKFYTKTESDNKYYSKGGGNISGNCVINEAPLVVSRYSSAKPLGQLKAASNNIDAWNLADNSCIKLVGGNNTMSFAVSGTTNDRIGMIQVGHTDNAYASVLGNLQLQRFGGSVWIGDIIDGRTLAVNGNAYVSGTLTQGSDINLKDNIQDITYTVNDIANAPAITFDYKNTSLGKGIGTIAQYWEDIAPNAVEESNGTLSLAYGSLATVNTILLARKVVELEERIKQLESE